MKNIAIILVCALAYCFGVQAQSSIPHSQAGFDVEKTGIAQGKIETVAYNLNPEKPYVPLNKNDAFQKVQKRRVQEKR